MLKLWCPEPLRLTTQTGHQTSPTTFAGKKKKKSFHPTLCCHKRSACRFSFEMPPSLLMVRSLRPAVWESQSAHIQNYQSELHMQIRPQKCLPTGSAALRRPCRTYSAKLTYPLCQPLWRPRPPPCFQVQRIVPLGAMLILWELNGELLVKYASATQEHSDEVSYCFSFYVLFLHISHRPRAKNALPVAREGSLSLFVSWITELAIPITGGSCCQAFVKERRRVWWVSPWPRQLEGRANPRGLEVGSFPLVPSMSQQPLWKELPELLLQAVAELITDSHSQVNTTC